MTRRGDLHTVTINEKVTLALDAAIQRLGAVKARGAQLRALDEVYEFLVWAQELSMTRLDRYM